ncbi:MULTISPECIES: hypothetical protein [Actinomadura]|uniref:Uncharacterized protein n=1 Tax=Actinomadura yumaensis TaxID=111807 RepID=A0ABW2CJX6_9ACTN|nr:hypothetical protein [Actinomadura sp. J1-007]MWK38735.1 hypothetical protein [Actinomadura sp. J1-007]
MDSTAPAPETLATTRRALHGVAELVLAGPQHRRSETIRLTIRPGGFGTVAEPDLRVEGAELVAAGRRIPLNGATCTTLAAAAGVEAGPPRGLYEDGSGMSPDEVVGVEAAAAEYLAQCYARGEEALLRLAPDVRPVLWPEHFDLAITVDEVNYGVSPGDGYLSEPYAYAGPWRLRSGAFWNAPFGAARPLRDIPGTTALHDFFMEARDRAATDPS